MVVSASLFCDFRSERPRVALRPLQPTCRRTGSLPSRHSVAAEPLGASDGQTLWSLIAGTSRGTLPTCGLVRLRADRDGGDAAAGPHPAVFISVVMARSKAATDS